MTTDTSYSLLFPTPQDEVRFSLLSTGTANSDKALDYFYIIELTGAIYLRRPLTSDVARDTRFTVSGDRATVDSHDGDCRPLSSCVDV